MGGGHGRIPRPLSGSVLPCGVVLAHKGVLQRARGRGPSPSSVPPWQMGRGRRGAYPCNGLPATKGACAARAQQRRRSVTLYEGPPVEGRDGADRRLPESTARLVEPTLRTCRRTAPHTAACADGAGAHVQGIGAGTAPASSAACAGVHRRGGARCSATRWPRP